MRLRHQSLIAAVIIFILAVVLIIYSNRTANLPDAETKAETAPHRVAPKTTKAKIHLYFANEECSYLTAEDRSLALPDNVVGRAKQIVNALIDGPETLLTPTIPKQTKLLALYVTEQGIAYANFNRTISDQHPGGSFSELLTIFSIVNTLCLNISDINAVKILIEGHEVKTLAGHVDIQMPFQPNLLMVK